MNSFEVTRVLNHWNGWWKQGRQIEQLQNSDVEEIKELQYYLSQSNEFATGYVRNRSYNINTMKFTGCVLPENSDGFHYPVDNFVSFDYQSGSQNSTYNRYLYVTGLEKKTYYEIKWYDFITGDVIMPIQIQKTDNKYRMKLEHPQLSLIGPTRPIVWFSMEKSTFSDRPMAEEEDVLTTNNMIETKLFSVYPNPFNEEIKVFTPLETSIEIYSVTGVFIDSYSIKGGETHINLSHLSRGIYFLYSIQNNQTIKIIKQ